MIHTLLVTNDLKIIRDVPLERSAETDIKWFWVDFDRPSAQEGEMLKTFFNFHPLAIEDCFQFLQRPKVDYFEGYNFFVLQNINPDSLTPDEIDLFVGPNYLISFHLSTSAEIDIIRQQKIGLEATLIKGPMYLAYLIMDQIVDDYFPIIYKIEDKMNTMDSLKTHPNFIGDLYLLRDQLLTLRRTIIPMREMLYRILNSDQLVILEEQRLYFKDVDDHLLKLSEMIESNREITADIRDSYISLNSNRMNTIMTTLTIIASIFIPLTFIVGVYGMNFEYMPELSWHYGYFTVWGIMLGITVGMLIGFKMKGWFK